MPEEKSFLDWEPNLTPNQVYANSTKLEYLTETSDGTIYWLEGRASEKGRYVIVKAIGDNLIDVTPTNYNVRSRVQEYGGKPFCIGKKFIYFVNFVDQRIYRQSMNNLDEIHPLTPEKNSDGSLGKYMNLSLSADEKDLFFVYEQEFENQSFPKNSIGIISLENEDLQEPTIIVNGNDFYCDLTISKDGTHCCWLTWNLPYMPWDYTELWSAIIESHRLTDIRKVAGGNGESIVTPIFTIDNEIIFVMDFPNKFDSDYQNYWNIYKTKQYKIFPITKEFVEFGFPLWTSGNKSIKLLSTGELICTYRKNGYSKLALLNLKELKFTKISNNFSDISGLAIVSNRIILIASTSIMPQSVISYELQNEKLVNETILVKSLSEEQILPEEQISIGKFISLPTKDGEKTFGYFYKPKNQLYYSYEKPPLLILVHGGPTANTHADYSNYIQYWTSLGFALFDIEYRGSTGFGRRYRDKLLGNWGLIDISDIEDAINYLLSKNVICPKVAITGGSAGGYSVQRALTYIPDLFQVGGSHYGIGNLLTLKKLIHKFESKYLDLLVGDDEKLFIERSPINHFDKLKAPMILFQGSDDKIVPPEVSREIAETLKQKGIKSEYIEYQGESHGFRQFEHKVDALTKESTFFKNVLKEI